MSTSYYYCREPVTSVRVEVKGGHAHVSVWVGHGLAGVLTVHADDAAAIVRLFAERADDLHCPMRTRFGGPDVGCIVDENVRGLDPMLCLIDEYGTPTTVAAVRAMAGKGKQA